MVTDQYAHVLDEGRIVNAKLIEEAFYGGHGAERVTARDEGGDDVGTVKEGVVATQVSNTRANAEMLMKLLANPEMAKLLKSLALTMEG